MFFAEKLEVLKDIILKIENLNEFVFNADLINSFSVLKDEFC